MMTLAKLGSIVVVTIGLECGVCHAMHFRDQSASYAPPASLAVASPNSVAQTIPPVETKAASANSSPAVCPPAEDSGRWYWKDGWLILLGALVSLYTTVIFERYVRFGELMRDVALARQHFEGHPSSTSTAHLQRCHDRSVEFFHLLENKEWSLNADGHHEAAASVGRLKNFTFRATVCLEKMLAGNLKGMKLDQYLSSFTIEYSEIYDKEFVAFERAQRPSIAALLRPHPQPLMPVAATVVLVDYFDKLL